MLELLEPLDLLELLELLDLLERLQGILHISGARCRDSTRMPYNFEVCFGTSSVTIAGCSANMLA